MISSKITMKIADLILDARAKKTSSVRTKTMVIKKAKEMGILSSLVTPMLKETTPKLRVMAGLWLTPKSPIAKDTINKNQACGPEILPWPYNSGKLSQVQPLECHGPAVWINGRFITINVYPPEGIIKVKCYGCGHTIQEIKLEWPLVERC